VSALGAVLGHRVSGEVLRGLRELGVSAAQLGSSGTTIPDVRTLPAPVAEVVQGAYAHGVAGIFLAATPLLVLAFVAVVFIREVPLKTTAPAGALEQAGAAGEVQGAGVAPAETAQHAVAR
jgi:hypothetical protein